jgi:hypothetical protein
MSTAGYQQSPASADDGGSVSCHSASRQWEDRFQSRRMIRKGPRGGAKQMITCADTLEEHRRLKFQTEPV